MKPVSIVPASNSRLRRSARRKARLVFGPMTTASSSSLRSAASASARLGCVDDHLGDHRIVEGRDGVAGLEAGVDPDAAQAFLALEVHDVDAPGRGQEAVLRVLGIDARFDRRARAADLALLERQRLSRGDPELPFDEVEAGHRLGHRMLDLKPGVHLEKVEVLGLQSRAPGSMMNSTVPAPT